MHIYLVTLMLATNGMDNTPIDATSYRFVESKTVNQCLVARDNWQRDIDDIKSNGVAFCVQFKDPIDPSKSISLDRLVSARIN